MKIGCVKEIKTQEYRVGLIPEHGPCLYRTWT